MFNDIISKVMRIKDFEDAINALKCSLVLDEVKLRNGHVRRFYAHREDCLVMWDENGRAYSAMRNCMGVREEDNGTDADRTVCHYERDGVYDLVFD